MNLSLKFAILESGRTQRTIARRLGIDETRFSRIVTGQCLPTDVERAAIARLLRRPQSVLFPQVAA